MAEKFEVTVRNYFDKKIIVEAENVMQAKNNAIFIFNKMMATGDQSELAPDNFGVAVMECVKYPQESNNRSIN